jgi:formyltetrahydrofolate deformylase
MRRLILTISCPDRTGIVAAVTTFIAHHGGSVLEASQFADHVTGQFFQRIEIDAETINLDASGFGVEFGPLAAEYSLNWRLRDTEVPQKVVIMVSKQSHCLDDLLQRWRNKELECDIPLVISNHPDMRGLVEWHGIRYAEVPVTPENRQSAFDEVTHLIEEAQADVTVLARYMQIVPPEVCERYVGRIINIHHSFLPSFMGARPYHQAYERGVKIIGATCHYVTADLDAGPIIEQEVARIDHADTPVDLVRIGQDVERAALARGLRWHLEDRVLISGNRTIVFD